jgi:type IV pilus assembly protein PilY1
MLTSSRRFFGNHFLRFTICAVLFLALGILGLYQVKNLFADDNTMCKTPPFLTAAVPPMLMLIVSRDHTSYFEAYSDTQKLRSGNDTIQTTYSNNVDYYGYFDSSKCYTYDSSNKYFDPAALASNHYCSGSQWSGNFLNWVTMTRMDVLRKVLYGGYRDPSGGDADNMTILRRVFLPDEGHTWVKVYKGSDVGQLTPYSSGSLDGGALSLFSVTCTSTMDQCKGALQDYPVIRVANGDFFDWDATETCEGYFQGESGACGGNTGANENPPAGKRLTDVAVRVRACRSGLLGDEMCKEYGTGKYKPIGLLQKYGEKEAMHFGLMTGSYAKNLSGGVLRKKIRSFKHEINADGTFNTSINGIVKTLSTLQLIDHSSPGGYYNGCGPFTAMSEGASGCRNWGNPVGEMLYEALRYYAGKGVATSVFDADDSALGAISLTKDTWNNPYNDTSNATVYNHPYCSKPNILVISDIYPSYDDDQLPGSLWGSFGSGDLTGLNATKLAKKIGSNDTNDNATFPGRFFIGQVAGNSTGAKTCSDKPVGALGQVKGFCPGYAGVNGTLYSAAVAYYGRITDLQPGISGKPSNIKINPATLAVALSDPLPTIDIKTTNGKISISPVSKGILGSATTNCSLVKSRYLPTPTGYNGELEIVWEDSYQASDFDKDWTQRIKWKVTGDNVDIETYLWKKTSGADMNFGYVVSGSTADEMILPIRAYGQNYTWSSTDACTGSPIFKRVGSACSSDPNTFLNCTSSCVAPFSRKTYTARTSGTAAASYLKTPLWYAAKWGSFNDVDNNNLPNRSEEWDKNGDGVPDNYFEVKNPGELFNSLDKAFSQVLLREGTAGAVATVTQEVHQGDIVVRAAFESYDLADPSIYTWWGHLESYQPYSGCSGFGASSDCNSTAGCTWDSGSGSCNGTVYSFQIYPSKFCMEMPSGGRHCTDAGVVLNGQSAGSREIFTGHNASTKTLLSSLDNATLKVHKDFDGGGVGSSDVSVLKDWISGSSTTAVNARDRKGWKLGDIVYSTPVAVGPPSVSAVPRHLADANFHAFLDNKVHRDQMVYVGANDGMLHAFNLGFWDNSTSPNKYVYDDFVGFPDTGKERWAYVPSNMLSELQCLAISTYGEAGCDHRFMVDLSPQAWDIKVNGIWKSILLGGERAGGDTYFALDITNPDAGNATVLWEYSVLKNYPASANVTTLYSTAANYERLKTLPMSWSLPYVGRLRNSANGTTPVAFFGGGIREFQPEKVQATSSLKLNQLGGAANLWRYLYYPSFHAINLDNGTDLWKGAWTQMLQTGTFQNTFKVNTGSTPVVPYAVSNVAAYDLFDTTGRSVTRGGIQDGFTDLLYAGDMNGTFYTMVMNSAGSSPSVLPSCMVGRKVQLANTSTHNGTVGPANVNPFRGKRQPITVTPVAALDTDKNLRVFFGTGKFDDVPTAAVNDKNDNATMSFYCLVENLAARLGNSTSTRCTGSTSVTTSPIKFSYNCSEDNGTRQYKWVKDVGNATHNATAPDGGSCFQCIFDFVSPGERVIDSALVAGGYVFFTTFIPKSADCTAGGDAYLYVLDYMCKPLKNAGQIIVQGGGGVSYYNVKGNTWGSGATSIVGAIQVSLGSGMPSRPVLDSSGTSIFIQTSDARLVRIEVNLGQGGESQIHGWTRED